MRRTKIINPKLLEVIDAEDKFILSYDGEPVKTDGENIVSHKSDYLLKRMIEEIYDIFYGPRFDGEYFASQQTDYLFKRTYYETQRKMKELEENNIPPPNELTDKFRKSYDPSVDGVRTGSTLSIYSLQKDEVEQGKDPLENDLESSIRFDRMLYLNESLKQKPEIEFITRWLKEHNCELPNLWPKLEQNIAEMIENCWDMDLGSVGISSEDLPQLDPQFIAAIKKIYLSLKPEERAFVVNCSEVLDSSDVIFPMALAANKCSLEDYEGIYFSASELREAFDYIRYYGIGNLDNEIINEIFEGESKTREFKSTLRWNLRSERNDDEVKYACLKTIAAFLNTDGGQLFLGVSDNGGIIGTEKDGFPDNDKYQLHLFALIKECLGNSTASFVDSKMVEFEGKYICLVKCKKSPKPVYLKFKNKEEAYFIRTGPGTTKLSTSEAHKYITEKFE